MTINRCFFLLLLVQLVCVRVYHKSVTIVRRMRHNSRTWLGGYSSLFILQAGKKKLHAYIYTTWPTSGRSKQKFVAGVSRILILSLCVSAIDIRGGMGVNRFRSFEKKMRSHAWCADSRGQTRIGKKKNPFQRPQTRHCRGIARNFVFSWE